MEQMYNKLRSEETNKRKRHDGNDGTCSSSSQPWNVKLDPLTYGSQLFDFSKIKGKKYANNPQDDPKKRGWYLHSFRTNGVIASLTFISGSKEAVTSPHIGELIKAGYQITEPSEKVDMNTGRGLFRVTQKRNDLATDMKLEPNDQAVCIDPGFLRPIQMGIMNAKELLNSTAENITRKAIFTHYTKEEWMKESGRSHQAIVEKKRREKNEAYGLALDKLAQTRRRCATQSDFSEYAKEAMETLVIRTSEMMCEKRCLFRWKCEKRLQSFLARVADVAFDRASTNVKRHSKYSILNEEEREALRVKMCQVRKERREENKRRIVFFGDGQFKCTMKGQPSIPKKKLLKLMAVRGVQCFLTNTTHQKCAHAGMPN